MARSKSEIKPEILKQICWLNGLSVAGVARVIGKSRFAVYRAVQDPRRYPVTYRRLLEALPRRISE